MQKGCGVKIIHTVLREDFGHLDRKLIRTELLAERGVRDVTYDDARNRLSIEYDPDVLTNDHLLDVMCRYGVYPDSSGSGASAPQRSDG
jgi:hypothetical protein